ncbi:hypothetical protein EVAR_79451_1 [Eumeta japonica]|uniref:Uncharacterized protein n=1 Tax=Eumeta variegata TaxID=151549 RepID=A0A4C1UDJ0_EUMVA|nr:hypothetical protein EVAR_79451_1 [Eumeta japonica]
MGVRPGTARFSRHISAISLFSDVNNVFALGQRKCLTDFGEGGARVCGLALGDPKSLYFEPDQVWSGSGPLTTVVINAIATSFDLVSGS